MIKHKSLFWFFVIVIFIAGCGTGNDTPGSPDDLSVPDTPAPTNTPVNTPTPLPPVGVLLTPDGSDQNLVNDLNPLISGYIRDLGLRFQILSNMVESDFQIENYQLVVVIPPFPDLETLAQSAPDTKFIAVGFNEFNPGENLSILRSGGGDFGVQGFIAGYIAAMITTDWRVGALSIEEDPNALAAREGFRVGVKYFCGLCNPKYAPTGINYLYPKYIDLPADASDLQIIANVDFLVDRVVNTFYIVPGASTPQMYRMLVAYQKNIIGPSSDYRDEYKDFWIASLGSDLIAALEEFWPQFITAETGLEVTPPLLITDINYDILSEGKIRMVENILEDVSNGYIKTNND